MAKRDRDWFRALAGGGIRIRMMEPGEAPALFAILDDPRSCRAGAPPRPAGSGASGPDDRVRWLVRHEIFVAEADGGGIAGFAAAGDLVELYWLAGLFVAAGHGEGAAPAALLEAVVKRAGWFFHRAVGLSAFREGSRHAPFFEARGFMAVSREDRPPLLEERFRAELPADTAEESRTVMVRWL